MLPHPSRASDAELTSYHTQALPAVSSHPISYRAAFVGHFFPIKCIPCVINVHDIDRQQPRTVCSEPDTQSTRIFWVGLRRRDI